MTWLLALLSSLRFFVGSLNCRHSFPRPLPAAEEKALLLEAEAGNTQARDKLIEHNMRLVAHIAKKYTAKGCETDDLISIGSIGLIKAVSSYSTGKSTRLATYASRCIENEILMYLRATKKQKNEVSLSEPVGTDKEGNEITLMDLLDSGDPEVPDHVDTCLRVRAMLKKMSRVLETREQRVLILRYGLGGRRPLTQREVADAMGISRSYVSRIEKAAMEKMKK